MINIINIMAKMLISKYRICWNYVELDILSMKPLDLDSEESWASDGFETGCDGFTKFSVEVVGEVVGGCEIFCY